MINNIKFMRNWNKKLDNKLFITIRKHSDYHSTKIGEEFYVILNNIQYSKAKLLNVTPKKFCDIDKLILILDTGSIEYSDIFKRLEVKETDMVDILLFEKMSINKFVVDKLDEKNEDLLAV